MTKYAIMALFIFASLSTTSTLLDPDDDGTERLATIQDHFTESVFT